MRLTHLLPTLSFALLLTCCQAQTGNVVDVATLRKEIQQQNTVQLVDVRTPQEWGTGHIEGASHIDWFDDDFKERVAKLDKTRPVRLYCAAGGRSEEARELLREMGFKDVKDLDGGMSAWKKAGAPVVK
ncbi:MAG: rhodanese-like domain-containing protein [Flavobacteriales bacterium]|jgi:rhodanese-related sulfurtransferase|nr:rhodanese-like domain-containing protein [Flavobacteriales bacterium]